MNAFLVLSRLENRLFYLAGGGAHLGIPVLSEGIVEGKDPTPGAKNAFLVNTR